MEEEVEAKRSYWYRDFIKQKISSVQPTLFEKLKPGKNSLKFKPLFTSSQKQSICIFFSFFTLGQNQTFYPEITKNLMFENCEFCEK